MTLTLGIDTSGVLAAGLARDGGVLTAARLDDPRAHAEELMPLVLSVLESAELRPADLRAVAVGMGPGPYTGLRVGIAAATTLAWTLGLPLHRVCGLDVLAQQVVDAGLAGTEFTVAVDARRRELYWARYAADGSRLAGPEVSAPDAVPGELVLGPGPALYPEAFAGRRVDDPRLAALDAGLLAALAPQLPDPGATPLYLRRPDAAVPTRRKSTLIVPKPRGSSTGRRG